MILRKQIRAGATDAEATGYIVHRYGSYVLLKPPVEAGTLPLWLGPLVFVVAGGVGAAATLRRRARFAAPAPLTPTETRVVDAMLAGEPRA